MSITATAWIDASAALQLCWLGAAVLVAIFSGILRPYPARTTLAEVSLQNDSQRLGATLYLVALAIGAFLAWLLAQSIFLAIHQSLAKVPDVAATAAAQSSGEIDWSPAELTLLQLISPAVGWAVGYILLGFRSELSFVKYRLSLVLPGLLAGGVGLFIALPMVQLALNISEAILRSQGSVHPSKHALLIAMETAPQVWIRIGLGVAAVVCAPMFEELLFRGFVQNAARRATGSPWLAVLLASGLFAVIHPGWTMLPIFVLSILMGLIYERTRNLWATTLMHAMFNGVAVVMSG